MFDACAALESSSVDGDGAGSGCGGIGSIWAEDDQCFKVFASFESTLIDAGHGRWDDNTFQGAASIENLITDAGH